MLKIEHFKNDEAIENKLTKVEELLDIKLPESYQTFIKSFDDGYAEPNFIEYTDEYRYQCETSVDYFYAFGFDQRKFIYIDYLINTFVNQKIIPPGYLPIACDQRVNLFCISANSNDYENIY